MKKPHKRLLLIGIAVIMVSGIAAAVYFENKRAASDAAEKKFIQEMIPHHEGAIVMAEQADEQASSPEIKALALSIISAQQKEINDMKSWYRQWWGSDVPRVPGDPHAGHSSESPESASTFDEGFIAMMIPHHEGAIRMAEEVLPKARHAEIKELAQSIVQSQKAEIEQMKVLLQKIKGTPDASRSQGTEVINYTDKGFDRANIVISAGTAVRWENKRSDPRRPMWIATDIHPTHEIYPEFDQARKAMREPEPEDSPYTFIFTKPGRWAYHDHSDPGMKGVVIVQ